MSNDDPNGVNQYPPGMDAKKVGQILETVNRQAAEGQAEHEQQKQRSIERFRDEIFPNSKMVRDKDGRQWVETTRPAPKSGMRLSGIMNFTLDDLISQESFHTIHPGVGNTPGYVQEMRAPEGQETVRTEALLFSEAAKTAGLNLTAMLAEEVLAGWAQRETTPKTEGRRHG